MGLTVLIDGDILTHRVGFSLQRTQYACRWEEQRGDEWVLRTAQFENAWRRDTALELLNVPQSIVEVVPRVIDLAKGDESIVCGRMKQYIEGIVAGCNAQLEGEGGCLRVGKIRTFLSGPSALNFRNAVATVLPYKHNRTGDKPIHYETLREYLIRQHSAEVSTYWEADDSIGMAWGGGTIVVSTDKDLKQFPGFHYDPVTGLLTRVTTDEARASFFRQVLIGDDADGVPGCYKVGPKLAEKLLPVGLPSEECWKRVVDKYTTNMAQYPDKHGDYTDPEARALETARLVKILNNEFDLWNGVRREPADLQDFITANLDQEASL